MVTSHVAHHGMNISGSGARGLVGTKLQTILVPPDLLHPSYSLCFSSQHFLALTLTETHEPLVTPSFHKIVWWQMAQGKGRLKGKHKHSKSCNQFIFKEVAGVTMRWTLIEYRNSPSPCQADTLEKTDGKGGGRLVRCNDVHPTKPKKHPWLGMLGLPNLSGLETVI